MSQQSCLEFRKRFVSDNNLPIQVLISPFFEERIEQCENLYGSLTKYRDLIKYINEHFDGNENKFLNIYYEIRDNIITDIINKDSYKEFNNSDLNQYKLSSTYQHRNLYTEEMSNKVILCVDLKKANFQALKFINPDIVNNAESYEDFIKHYSDIPYIVESKYTRQVIFGKLNPSRQITIERFILEKILKIINNIVPNKFELFNFGNDELMFYCKDVEEVFYKELVKKINQTVKDELNVYIKTSFVKIEPIHLIMGNGQKLTIFKKIDVLNNQFKIMTCPVTYIPQVLRLINGEEIKQHDLAFMYENNLAYLASPLMLKE